MFEGLRAIQSAVKAGDTEASPSAPIDAEYSTHLDTIGKAQYHATRRRNQSRAVRLRKRVVDGPALGAGIGRTVYPVPRNVVLNPQYDSYVVKFATPDPRDTFGVSRDGRVQNRTETAIWNETHCDYLVPVTASHPRGYWLLMPLAKSREPATEDIRYVTDRIATDCGLEQVTADITEQDIVQHAGKWKLCDYGFHPDNQ